MGFKLNGAPYNEDDMNIPIYKRRLEDGAVGKSNHTGIIVQQGLDKQTEDAVVAHETVHQKDPHLDYDDENFYYKGKTYPRNEINEFDRNLPWEKKAYKESDKILKQKTNDVEMKQKFKMDGNHKGGSKPFVAMAEQGLVGPSMDGASNPPAKKGSSIEKLRNSVKYKMAQNPSNYGIKPGDRESKYLDSFKKDSYYKGRQRDEAAIRSSGNKVNQQAKKDVVVNGKKVNKGIVSDKERVEGRKGEYSDLSIVTNKQYDKHGDRDYTKVGAPRPDVMVGGKKQSGYKLKGNLPGAKKNVTVEK